MNITILDLLDFCLKHRSNKVFRGWTPEQIGSRIILARHFGGLAIATSNNGVVGICCSIPDHTNKILHVNEVLCIQRGALKALMAKYKAWFDGYTITATRRGKSIAYRPRVVHLLS